MFHFFYFAPSPKGCLMVSFWRPTNICVGHLARSSVQSLVLLWRGAHQRDKEDNLRKQKVEKKSIPLCEDKLINNGIPAIRRPSSARLAYEWYLFLALTMKRTVGKKNYKTFPVLTNFALVISCLNFFQNTSLRQSEQFVGRSKETE